MESHATNDTDEHATLSEPPQKKRKAIPAGPGMKKVAGIRTRLQQVGAQINTKSEQIAKLDSISVERSLKTKEREHERRTWRV